MFTSLKNKLVVVTGGEMGIGKAIVKKFHEAGSQVIIAGLDGAAAEKCCKDIGSDIMFFKTDISIEEEVESFSQKVIKKAGTVDILVNNAGIITEGNVADTDYEDWKKILKVNLDGAFLMSHYIINDHMLPEKKGVIVNISSEAGIDGFPDQVAYNVSKAGLISLTKSIAVDFADDYIRANAVCPGTTFTPLVEKAKDESDDPEKFIKELEEIRPLNRLGKPEEIASAVLCVASEELGYATGSIFSIDGGSTAK
ncbi:MAG: SDR family NAD(P)-dependent oxidoreductase [Halanaerobiaceae bacterium]